MQPLKLDLTGTTALVTGASRGIGRAIAVGLGRHGAAVIVNYHANAEAAQQVVDQIEADGGRAWAVQADVSSKQQVSRLFEQARRHLGDRLHILVNNAGGPAARYPLADMPEEAWDECLAVNLKGAFLCTQAAWPLLVDGEGRVINVTSISARSGGGPGMAHYAAAKAAMSNFTRACAKEFASRHITVNGIAPGVIYTDLHKHGTPKQELDDLRTRIPLQRLGDAEDIVGAALLFCSRDGSYITGEIIEINGGLMMN